MLSIVFPQLNSFKRSSVFQEFKMIFLVIRNTVRNILSNISDSKIKHVNFLIYSDFMSSSKFLIVKESYISIMFLIISGSSIRRKFCKISHGAKTQNNIIIC